MSNPQDEFELEEDDDDIDIMAKFIEGADMDVVKEHSSLMEDDNERIAKNKQKKANESNLPEEKKK